jgi:predicted component of type VI protein secretion system
MRKEDIRNDCFFQTIRKHHQNGTCLKLIPSKKLSFPTADIEKLENNALYINFFGIIGINSPLPENLLKNIHLDEGELAWKDFLSIFNSRLYELFFLLWKKYHPITHTNNSESNKYLEFLINLSGRKNFLGNPLILQFFDTLFNKNQTKRNLSQLVKIYLNISDVSVKELTLSRSKIYNIEPLSSTNRSIILGENSLLGDHIMEAKKYIKIIVRLNNIKEYYGISSSLKPLCTFIEKYLGPSYQYQFVFFISYEQDDLLILGRTDTLLGFSWLLGSSNTRRPAIINNIPLTLGNRHN